MKKNKGHRQKNREIENSVIHITEFGKQFFAMLPQIIDKMAKEDEEQMPCPLKQVTDALPPPSNRNQPGTRFPFRLKDGLKTDWGLIQD